MDRPRPTNPTGRPIEPAYLQVRAHLPADDRGRVGSSRCPFGARGRRGSGGVIERDGDAPKARLAPMSRTDRYVQVALRLLEAPQDPHWSADLRADLRLRSGALYPILWDMLDDELIEDGWEDTPPNAPKGRPRRYYTVTAKGLDELAASVRTHHVPEAARSRRARPATA